MRLRRYASEKTGRSQLAIDAFASAMEVILRSLAGNSGLDPIDLLGAMRDAHEAGEKNFGLDVHIGQSVDMMKAEWFNRCGLRRSQSLMLLRLRS